MSHLALLEDLSAVLAGERVSLEIIMFAERGVWKTLTWSGHVYANYYPRPCRHSFTILQIH